MISDPTRAPAMVPLPPIRLVPPITQAAMAFQFVHVPTVCGAGGNISGQDNAT